MSDEFNKGYFSTGPQRTYEAEQGRWARLEDERRAREAAQRQSEREGQERLDDQLRHAAATWRPSSDAVSYDRPARTGSGGTASFVLCVKGCAVLGALLMAAYAALGLNLTASSALLTWGMKGVLWGAAGGAVLYVALTVLAVALKVLAALIKFAVCAALILGLFYLFS